jgi:hypothetical protein
MVRFQFSLVAKRSRASALSAEVRQTELRDLVRQTRFYVGSDGYAHLPAELLPLI